MKRVVVFFVALLVMLFVSRSLFERLHLYDEFMWLDIPMHFLGGFLLSGFFGSFYTMNKKKPDLIMLVSLFFIVASFWEVYEYFIRQVVERDWYGFFDTVKDYGMGTLGMLFGYYVLYQKKYL